MTSSANNRGFSRMGVDPTVSGLVDGTDFPHSALFHALNIATQGSYAIIEGNDFDITQSDSSGKTQFAVAAGRVVRDGKLQAAVSTANFTQGTPTAFEEPTSGFAYYLLVVNSSNALELKNNGGTVITDAVPNPATTDIPIAVLRLGSGETVTQRHVQFLTTAKKSNSLSVPYENSGVYTEVGSLTGDANGITMTGLYKLDTLPTATVATDDKIILQDTNDSDKIKTATAQSIANLKDISGKQDSLSGLSISTATVATDDKVLIQDTDDSNNLKTVTTQSIANLYSETDTLQLVTARGASTTLGIENNGYRKYNPPPSLADALTDLTNGSPPTFSHYYVNAAVSPLDIGQGGQVITIKNVHTGSIGITHSVAFEGGTHPTTDQRFGAPTVITLESYESVTLQYLLDSSGVPTATWYIISLDTSGGSGGIASVVADTSPQLGGDLDVNGNKIVSASSGNIEIEPNGTGDIILDGDVSIDAGHTFRATTLPVVDINSDPNPLVLDTHAGRYLLCSSNITLPATSTQGDQYYLLNDSASSISIQRNGNNINGAGSDVTLTAYKGATCIAIGSNNWIVLGV